MHRPSRPSPAASRSRKSQRGALAASQQPSAQRAEDRRASWVVRVLTVAALVGGVLHFLDRFREEPSLAGARSPLSPRAGARSSGRQRAVVPRLAPVADGDSSAVRAEAVDHDGWERAELDEQPDGQDSEAFAAGREPPGQDTGIVITPVATVAHFDKDEPPAVRSQPQPDAKEADPKQTEQAHPHVDPAVDTGIVVTPISDPPREK